MTRSHPIVRPALAFVALVAATTLCSNGGGVQPGLNGVPMNATVALPSCGQCHAGAAPSAARPNPPVVSTQASHHALQPGEAIGLTTSISGGVAGGNGGFLSEATVGVFVATTGDTVLMTSSASISHANNASRSWSYSYTAPSTTGPVDITTIGMASNGVGTAGDQISFGGFDGNALQPTPQRFTVLPAGVSNLGVACPDGYGNYSVLGANSAPTLGNASFAFELRGASPQQWAIVWGGLNPVGFTPVDLAVAGLTGCTSYLANVIPSWSVVTTPGSAERAEGEGSFAVPIPNMAALQGQTFQVQAGFLDPSVATIRAMPITFSNGLEVTIL